MSHILVDILVSVVYFSNKTRSTLLMTSVVYFDQLLAAARTQKLVETFFQLFINLFCWFQSFFSDFTAEINKKCYFLGWFQLFRVKMELERFQPAFGCAQHPKAARYTQHSTTCTYIPTHKSGADTLQGNHPDGKADPHGAPFHRSLKQVINLSCSNKNPVCYFRNIFLRFTAILKPTQNKSFYYHI